MIAFIGAILENTLPTMQTNSINIIRGIRTLMFVQVIIITNLFREKIGF